VLLRRRSQRHENLQIGRHLKFPTARLGSVAGFREVSCKFRR
jgi:hypothetical protein